MSKYILFSLLFFFSVFLVNGQSFLQSNPSVVGLSLGNAHAIEGLGMSALANPALGLANAKWQTAISFHQFSFGDYPLSQYQAGFKIDFQNIQQLGIQAHYSGNSAVGILQCSVIYGRKLFEQLSMGIQLNYGQRKIDKYETAGQMSMDIGLASQPLQGLYIGAWARHLLQIKGESLENASLLISAKYHLSKDFRIYTSFYSTLTSDLIIGTGIYYQIIDQLDIKLSYMPHQASFAFGVGMNLSQNWGIHSAAYLQPSFGTQAALGAYYQKQ